MILAEKDAELNSIACILKSCSRCPLGSTRTHVVPGEGYADADIMFIGEGPGHDEDMTGRPFVGKAGQLLDKMLLSIGLNRTNSYIANIVKCRPPQNRTPEDSEAVACLPYLRKQVSIIKPKIIVCLGSTAARNIISRDIRITRERGSWHESKGCFIIATYHPSALLRDISKKKEAWDDMKSISSKIAELGLKIN